MAAVRAAAAPGQSTATQGAGKGARVAMLRASPPIHAHLVAREASYWDDHPLPFVLPENLRRVYKTLVWSTNFNGWWACRSIWADRASHLAPTTRRCTQEHANWPALRVALPLSPVLAPDPRRRADDFVVIAQMQLAQKQVPFRAPAASTRLPQVTRGGGDFFAPCFSITGSGIKVASAHAGKGLPADPAFKQRSSSAEHACNAGGAHDPEPASGNGLPSHQPARALPGGGGRALSHPAQDLLMPTSDHAMLPPHGVVRRQECGPIVTKAATDSAFVRQLRGLEAAAASAAAAAGCDWRVLLSGVGGGSRRSGASRGISRSGSAGDVMCGRLCRVKAADDVGWEGGEVPFMGPEYASGCTPNVYEHEHIVSSSSAPPSGASKTRPLLAKQPRAAAGGSGRVRARELMVMNLGAMGSCPWEWTPIQSV